MSPPGSISDDDSALFREAAGLVKKIEDDRVRPPRKRIPARPRPIADTGPVGDDRGLVESPDMTATGLGDTLFFARPGVQKRVLRKLRRGQISNQADLDLHGLNLSEARAAFAGFLQECRDNRWRCVRIVHGKGLSSTAAEPVIKGHVNRWLRLRDEVLAFSSTRPNDGGTGAVYVLLRD